MRGWETLTIRSTQGLFDLISRFDRQMYSSGQFGVGWRKRRRRIVSCVVLNRQFLTTGTRVVEMEKVFWSGAAGSIEISSSFETKRQHRNNSELHSCLCRLQNTLNRPCRGGWLHKTTNYVVVRRSLRKVIRSLNLTSFLSLTYLLIKTVSSMTDWGNLPRSQGRNRSVNIIVICIWTF